MKQPALFGKRGRHAGQAGFTLVELMVTLVMVVGASVIAIPTINAMVNRFGGNRAVHEMISDLHVARTLAIRHGGNATVTFNSPGANQYTVSWGSPVQTRVVDISVFKGGVRFQNSPPVPPEPPATSIVFTPQGLAEDNPPGWGNIYITDRDNSEELCIEVTMAGAVSEMSYSAAANQWIYR
jgi:prepilin-type N-terminal cleavage/methylation domain-containing protein